MKHLIFLGAPGSGKGTQALNLVSQKSFNHISTGDLLRFEIAKDTKLGREVKAVMDSGMLVSDDLVIRLLQSNVDLNLKSYIFDGYPRNLIQAKTLDEKVLKDAPSLAIYFEIDIEKLATRLANRRTCKKCGAIFNLVTKAPKISGVCDQCGSRDLAQRADDNEEIIKNRLKVFNDTIEPVINYYQDLGRLFKVNAEMKEDLILKEILSKV